MSDLRVSRRAEFWNPESLCYRFFAEAKRLWELETGNLRLTTIQAALILYTVYASCAADKLGRVYVEQALVMVRELKLFETCPEITNAKMRAARDFTAWVVFWFQRFGGFLKKSSPPRVLSSTHPCAATIAGTSFLLH
jgi:hypothetical protein